MQYGGFKIDFNRLNCLKLIYHLTDSTQGSTASETYTQGIMTDCNEVLQMFLATATETATYGIITDFSEELVMRETSTTSEGIKKLRNNENFM